MKELTICLTALLVFGCIEPTIEELKTIVSPGGEFAAVKIRKDIHATVGRSTQIEIRRLPEKDADRPEPCLLWSGYRMGIESFSWKSPHIVELQLLDTPHNRKQSSLTKRSTCFGIRSEEVWIAAPLAPPPSGEIPEDARGWGRN